MARIIKGYWDCKFCGRTGIDGLVDICEGCGKQKSEDVKYYMKKEKVEVSTEELIRAGIRREECDGNHKDWVCNYCNQLNNWADQYCAACNAPKTEATHEYGMIKRTTTTDYQTEEPIKPEEKGNLIQTENNESCRSKTHSFLSFFWTICKEYLPAFLLSTAIILGILGPFIYGVAPITKEVHITGFEWERVITIEEEKTVKESDWEVPDGGRVYDEKWEFKEFETVLDHYETVVETKSRQVIDYYETNTYYTDNGNGTFTEHTSKTPVYTTEYYTETRQEPVYRQESVYDTKYYYEIERWVETDSYTSGGNDQNVYWNEDYVLSEKERDTLRSESYYIEYDDGTISRASYAEWINMSVGDGYIIKTCRLGIVYEKEEIHN